MPTTALSIIRMATSRSVGFLGSEAGRRSCVMVFDLDDASRIPAVSEPFFQGGAESVPLVPRTNLDDLQRGLGRLQV